MIFEVNGDLLSQKNISSKNILIAHSCNNAGKWGAGFSGQLSRLCPSAEQEFRKASEYNIGLGDVQFVVSGDFPIVANMIAQCGISYVGLKVVDYPSLTVCIEKVYNFSVRSGVEKVIMPRVGSGLGGGDWKVIRKIIESAEKSYEVDTVIYKK